MPDRPSKLWLVLLCAAIPACGTGSSWIERGKEQFGRGEFYQAYYCLQNARREGEDEGEVERLYWPYRTAFLLERARRRVFSGNDEQALEDLAKVLAVDPTNKIALVWERKAKDKLARDAAEEAREKLLDGDLAGALIGYQASLTYWPNNADAEDGLTKVTEAYDKLRDKAHDNYLDGIRALADQLFGQTQYHMLIALKSDPTLDAAASTSKDVGERIAAERFRNAEAMEKKSFWSAALAEYRAVEAVLPAHPGLKERLASVTREVEAVEIARQGEIALFRGKYAQARELTDKAFELSVADRPRYNDQLLRIRQRENEDRYVEAKDREFQYDFEGAVERFREIEADMPSFLDVKARLTDLQASIDAASDAYEAGVAAEQKGEIDAAIEHFTDATVHHPKFKDAAARLDRLRAARGSG